MEHNLPSNCITHPRLSKREVFAHWLNSIIYATNTIQDDAMAILRTKEVACSFNNIHYHCLYYRITNLEAALSGFSNAQQIKALECDAGHVSVRDMENILAIRNQFAAQAYCDLQTPDVSFARAAYNPKLFSGIKTKEQYDIFKKNLQDHYLSVKEGLAVSNHYQQNALECDHCTHLPQNKSNDVARQSLMEQFLASNCDPYLFFIDDVLDEIDTPCALIVEMIGINSMPDYREIME